jgi:hypothetical protein
MWNTWRASALVAGGAAVLALTGASSAWASGTYLSGSDVVSPDNGCKIWENYQGSGNSYEIQGLVISWGDTCQMGVYRSSNGGSFELVSDLYSTTGAQEETGFHADGTGYKVHTCLYDVTTGYRDCDAAT